MTTRHVRCAIYTRKSTDEGLDKEFNTLQAQREACEAFVKSQAGEGWIAIRDAYDDSGFSGGTLERPAFQRLLSEVDRGRIDMVVVYKVDRLTRSLTDFAKIVDRFEKHNVSFVSVTQSFNTSTSMGRLTLNVLLSFAQFEREIASERIRDKIAASRRKGMWTGGNVPLGYDVVNKKLVPNLAEAKTVKHIFERYLKLGSVRALRDELKAAGITSKARRYTISESWGGTDFFRGALYTILQNRIYVGETVHKGVAYAGEHKAIVDRELFDRVQARLDAKNKRKNDLAKSTLENPLTGLIFDDRGNRMSPAHSRKKGGRRHRYYVSLPLLNGEKARAGSLPRVPAYAIESLVEGFLRRIGVIEKLESDTSAGPALPSEMAMDGSLSAATELELDSDAVRRVVQRIEIHAKSIILHLGRQAISASIQHAATGEQSEPIDPDQLADRLRARLGRDERLDEQDEHLIATLPVRAKFVGGARRISTEGVEDGVRDPLMDTPLIKAVVRAHSWLKLITEGKVSSIDELARVVGHQRSYVAVIIQLAILSPQITRAILQGGQPQHLSLAQLIEGHIPPSWLDQQQKLL